MELKNAEIITFGVDQMVIESNMEDVTLVQEELY